MRRCGSVFLALTVLAASALPAAEPAAPSPRAADHLDRWAAASQAAMPVEFEQYQDRYGEQYPEPVLRFAAALLGPVDADALRQAYRWTVAEQSDFEIRLRATPRRLERPAVTVNLAASSADAGAVLLAGAAIRGDVADQNWSFDVVLDRRFIAPRLILWRSGPDEADPDREGIELLSNDEQFFPLDRRGGNGDLFAEPAGDIQLAAAIILADGQNAGAVDPTLLELLSQWERAAGDLQSLELKFKRFDYDNIFEVETRGVGRFVYVAPGVGLYELRPASVVDRADGRTSPKGARFAVSAAKPQLYWWNGETVTIVDDREKTYDELRLPKRNAQEAQAVGSWDVIWQVLAGPQKALPAVVDIRAEQVISRFQWTLVEGTESRIMLEGRPKSAADRRHLSRIDVILEPKTFRTTATRMIDSAASRETVHVFEYVRVNDAALNDMNAWKPDLSGLAPVGPPPMAPPADPLPTVPPLQD
ncbi:MAG: hypothetical protein KF774_10200 [Planctomyces sp.]|nr:hypothetical protein [Planctomyces sp.]